MDVHTESYPAKVAVGIQERVPVENIPELWMRLHKIANAEALHGKTTVPVGLSYQDPASDDPNALLYAACLVLAAPREIASLETITVPGGRFAVYRHRGPYELIAGAFDRLFGEWLPPSGLLPIRRAWKSTSTIPWLEPSALLTDLAIPIQ